MASRPNSRQRRMLLAEAFEREGGRCFYCDRAVRLSGWPRPGVTVPHDIATSDHIIPVSHGGRNRADNVVLACYACNQERRRMPADLFLMKTMVGDV